MSEQTHAVTHEPDASRFALSAEGLTAELVYRLSGNQIVFTHTSVPQELEGRGIGSALVKTGLEYARQEGMEVVPLCPFVRSYIERKPEYQSLVQKSSGGFA